MLNPHILVCLTQEAYGKFSGIIRPGGLLLTDSKFVKVERKVDARQVELEMYGAVMAEIGNPIVFNICMLGALIGLTDLVRPNSALEMVKSKINPDFLEMNEKAFGIGMRLADSRR